MRTSWSQKFKYKLRKNKKERPEKSLKNPKKKKFFSFSTRLLTRNKKS